MNVESSLGAKTFPLNLPVGLKSVTMQENFDAVQVPGLPGGWSTTVTAAACVRDSGSASDLPLQQLLLLHQLLRSLVDVSPSIAVNSAAARSLRNRFNLKPFDGGCLRSALTAANSGHSWPAGSSCRTDTTNDKPRHGQLYRFAAGMDESSGNMMETKTAYYHGCTASAVGERADIRLRWARVRTPARLITAGISTLL